MTAQPSREDDAFAALAALLVRGRRAAAATIRRDTRLRDGLGIDSLAMVEILEGTCERFGVHIDDGKAKGFLRVRDLVEHVLDRLR